MRTEQEIIYTIWDIVRGGESNSDDPINERLMRRFLQIHRSKRLNTYYKKGNDIPDECFQSLGTINFSLTNGVPVSDELPKVVRFEKGYFGLMIDKNGYPISIMNSEEFRNATKDRFNKYHPRLMFLNRVLTLNTGLEQSCDLDDVSNSEMNVAIRKLKAEESMNSVTLSGKAVLVNPDDESGYDWTADPYPMPDELIEDMVNSVNAREFNLFLRTRTDETGDIRFNVADQNTREEL